MEFFTKTSVDFVSQYYRKPCYFLWSTTRGGLKVVWGPWLNLRKGPFLYIYKTVVNRKKINERTEVFVLLKQKSLSKKRIVN